MTKSKREMKQIQIKLAVSSQKKISSESGLPKLIKPIPSII
jgi:hypothetical protein